MCVKSHSGSTHSEARWQGLSVHMGAHVRQPLHSSPPASPSINLSSTEGNKQLSWPAQQSQLLHIRTQTDQARGNWFPEFGFILQYRHHWSHLDTEIEVEALSHQYRIAAWSVEEATPGAKEASTFTCFRIAFIPFALTNFIRLKHCTQASSKMTLKVWSWVRILGPHKPNLWLCCMGSVVIPDRTQNGKLEGKLRDAVPNYGIFNSQP